MMDMSDFLVSYPEIEEFNYPPPGEPRAQTFIANKYEFKELTSTPFERIQRRGKLFRQQEFLKRYMRRYDRILIMWRTGTGKTCGFAAVTEFFKNSGSRFRKFIVITKSDTLIEDFKKQLVCKCTDGVYEVDENGKQRTTAQKGAVTSAVNKYYELTTYTTFASKIQDIMNKDKSLNTLRETYSDVIVFLDEVQEIRLSVEDKSANKTSDTIRLKQMTYETLHKFFHTILRSKVVVASATPMVNSVGEIADVLNLILPEAGSDPETERNLPFKSWQLPTNVDPHFYERVTIEQMEPYLRGRISYVRELDTGIVPIEMGFRLESSYNIGGVSYESQAIVYASEMSEFQTRAYLNVQLKDYESGRGAFYSREEQAINFVFPDGSVGSDGFNKYFALVEGTREDYVYRREDGLDVDMRRALTTDLQKHSCKYYEIVNLCREAKGISFVYLSIVQGSGLIVLGKALEEAGFEQYINTTSVFVSKVSGTSLYCAGGNTDDTYVNPNFPKRPRYLLLSTSLDTRKSTGLELINSYANRYGEYISVILVSPLGQSGISINNVMTGHLGSSDWHETAMYQALSRFIRATSHTDLMDEQGYCLRRDGKDPALARIPIKIYKHAAQPLESMITPSIKARYPLYGQSLDLQRYALAEEKNILIKGMENILKRCSIDCYINKARNIRPTDVNGSAVCDYRKCDYDCYDPPPNPNDVDYSTYDILYSDEIVDRVIEEIIGLFKSRFKYRYSELYSLLPYEEKYVDMSLEKIISRRIIIYDRFGFPCRLRDGGVSVYLANQITEDGESQTTPDNDVIYSLSNYTSDVTTVERSNMSVYIDKIQGRAIDPYIDYLKRLDLGPPGSPPNPEFYRILDELYQGGKAQVLEDATYPLLDDPNFHHIFPLYQLAESINKAYTDNGLPPLASRYQVEILKYFSKYIFAVYEPVDAVQQIISSVRHEEGQRGRPMKAVPTRIKRVTKVSQQAGTSEVIFIHTLYTVTKTNTDYADMVRHIKAEGRIRLYKPSEEVGWRDLTEYEIGPYNALAQTNVQGLLNEFNTKFDIYATDINGVFRIVDRQTENPDAKNDLRLGKRGKKCLSEKGGGSSWYYYELVDLMMRLDIPSPDSVTLWDIYTKRVNEDEQTFRSRLINFLYSRMKSSDTTFQDLGVVNKSTDALIYYVRWYVNGRSRNEICILLKNWFQDRGRLYIS